MIYIFSHVTSSADGNVSLLGCQFCHFGPDRNISTTIRRIDMKFWTVMIQFIQYSGSKLKLAWQATHTHADTDI